MRPSRDGERERRLGPADLAPLAAAALVVTLAAIVAITGGGIAAGALAGGLCGGVVGGWAGALLARRAPAEQPVDYTLATHERPGWRMVDLQEGHRADR